MKLAGVEGALWVNPGGCWVSRRAALGAVLGLGVMVPARALQSVGGRVVRAGATGLLAWKDPHGRTLKTIEEG